MFWKVKSAADEPPGELWVTAIDAPRQKPFTEMERWVLSVLLPRRALPLTELVHLIADRLYRDALGHGAAAVDIGLFGVKLFTSEAATLVASGDGQWWEIGKAEDGLAFAVGRLSGEFSTKPGLES